MTLPKLHNELVERRIVEAVRAGATRAAAAEAARVGRTTLFRWLKDGAAGHEPYASFLTKVREAEGALESELVGIIKGHSADSWQAAAWLLERKWGKRWAIRRERVAELPVPTEAEARELLENGARLLAEMKADAKDQGAK